MHAGATDEAIRAHYDVGDEFFRLWLDRSMTYSCARWEEGDDLESAQRRKLDLHVTYGRAAGKQRVLDIGCGWGSLLERLSVVHAVDECVGLTLSKAQFDAIDQRQIPGVEARLEHWQHHNPASRYDSIICIGAMEHFVTPAADERERLKIYRDFFAKCHEFLEAGASMSLQTITYGIGRFKHGAIASIFPESDLPRLCEVVWALEGLFEVSALENRRSDYAATCRSWLANLRRNYADAAAVVGEGTTNHYARFLNAAARGFDSNVFNLVRMSLRRVDRG